eukprot:TRINITY_DN12925_c0_g1_i1.p1 TRINITY_DN12925_c0_g1~~TRINITY_DN12925_c0_g1_i1.p1  ORF type:complete len:1114 (+),score=320.82 TRINITY_DN12925_c0_g1_i1:219-3560(+)
MRAQEARRVLEDASSANEVRASAPPNSSSWSLSLRPSEALPSSFRTSASLSLAAEQQRQDELFVRRELEAVEDRIGRQVLRLQEQMERFIDMMMHPLESKVAALEGRQPALDVSLGEMRGNLRGLQDSVEMQVKRADQVEIGLRKWRKNMEDDLHAACTDLAKKLSEGRMALSEMVTRTELVDVADMLKLELKKLVAQVPSGDAVTRKELATVTTYLREELASVERVAAAAFNTPAHKELTSAAEAVRNEMRNLVAREGGGSSFAVSQIGGGEEALHHSIDDLAERLARSEQMLEETRLDVRQFRNDVRAELRGLLEKNVTSLSDRPLDEHDAATSVGLDVGSREEQVAELLGRLQTLEEQQRNFVADISSRLTSWERGKLHRVDADEVPIATSENTVSILPNEPQATMDLASRIDGLEEQQHILQARSHVITDLASRIHALEEQQHSLQARDDLTTDMSGRIGAFEEQQQRLPRLRESSECDRDRMSDSQLMLLDLNRRVCSLEHLDNDFSVERFANSKTCLSEASSVLGATTVASLKEVAELAQKLALDLQRARRTAGESGLQGLHPLCETAGHVEDQSDCLPPVAAIKLNLSSRLQELHIPFQLEPGISESFPVAPPCDTTSLCVELRAEVAAVWDAIAELAEKFADSSSGDRAEAVETMAKEAFSRIASEEAVRRRALEEEDRRKAETEEARIASEEEARRKAETEGHGKITLEVEEARKAAADIVTKAADGAEARIKQAEKEVLCRIAEEEALRRVAETEKQAEKEQARKKAAEAEVKMRAAYEEDIRKKAAEIMAKAADGAETRIKHAEQEALCRIAAEEAASRKALEEQAAEHRKRAIEELEESRKKTAAEEPKLSKEDIWRKTANEEFRRNDDEVEEAIKKAMEEEEIRRKAMREEENDEDEDADEDEEDDEEEEDEEDEDADEAKHQKRELQTMDEPKRPEEDARVNVSEDETVSEDDTLNAMRRYPRGEKHANSHTPPRKVSSSQQRTRRSPTSTSPQRPLGSGSLTFTLPDLPLQLLHVSSENHKLEVKEVPLTKESMSHGDCYVLCDGKTVYTWMGDECSPIDRNACVMHAENLAWDHHGQDARFWSLLGGEGPTRPPVED